MCIKRRMFTGIMMIMIIALLAACGGPEQKKIKFYNKGKALYEKGDYVKARLELKNALQIDIKYADAFYMLGMIALKSEDPRGAYANFSKVVELSPKHWDAQVQLGRFLLGSGKTDEAMGKADLVLKNDPKHEDALLLKGMVLLKEKDNDGAARFLETVVGREVHKPEGYLLSDFCVRAKGRYAERRENPSRRHQKQ